jgi:hypothetical protein
MPPHASEPTGRYRLRLLACAVAIWIGVAIVITLVVGYMNGGATGVYKQLLNFLFVGLLLLPVVPALLFAQKLEKRLKPRFRGAASFLAITAALVVSAPIGLYFAINVLRNIKG